MKLWRKAKREGRKRACSFCGKRVPVREMICRDCLTEKISQVWKSQRAAEVCVGMTPGYESKPPVTIMLAHDDAEALLQVVWREAQRLGFRCDKMDAVEHRAFAGLVNALKLAGYRIAMPSARDLSEAVVTTDQRR